MYDQVQLYSPQQPQIVYVPAQPAYPQWYPGPHGAQGPPVMQGPTAPHSPRGPGPGPWANGSYYYDNPGTATHVRVAYSRNGNYAEQALAMTSAESELEELGEVIRDFGRQMTEATMRVRRQNQGNVKSPVTVVKPLRKMKGIRSVAATDEKLPVMTPRDPKTALELVQKLVTMLSSKLVPTIAYERQGSITYVLKMVDTYIRSIRSFFTGDVVEQEDEEDQHQDETTRSLTYSLQCVEAALVGIPSSIENDAHKQAAEKIRNRCNEIVMRIDSAEGSHHEAQFESQVAIGTGTREPLLRHGGRQNTGYSQLFGQKKESSSKLNEKASVSSLGS